MPTFFTDSGSFRNLQVTGSTIMSASSGIVLQIIGSGSTLFSISGSSGELFRISDSGSSTSLFSVSSGSVTIFDIDSSKNVRISGSSIVTGSLVVNGGSGVELRVVSTGVNIGNTSTDTHTTIGTQVISGSLVYIPTASVAFNGEIVRFGAGTLTTGQLYFLSSSGTWSLANANSTGSSTGMLGLAVGSSPTTNGLLIRGFAASSSYTQSTGSILYMATSSGIFTQTSPSSSNHVVRVIGYKTTISNTIYFDPDKTWVTLA